MLAVLYKKTLRNVLMMRAVLALVSTLTLKELRIRRSKEHRQQGENADEKQASKSRGENSREEAGCRKGKDKGF